jgi:hypothetical protein
MLTLNRGTNEEQKERKYNYLEIIGIIIGTTLLPINNLFLFSDNFLGC